MTIIEQVGLVSSIVMPLWNIPLIVKMVKRQSSADISMAWVLGVWICAILMAPSGITSKDIVWKTFNIVNLILFSAVVFTVFRYRKGPNAKKSNNT